MNSRAEEAKWQVDRHVPVTFLVGLLIQTMGLIAVGSYWVSGVENRMSQYESDVVRQNGEIATQKNVIQDLRDGKQRAEVALATITAQFSSLQQSMAEVKQSQNQLNEVLRDIFKDLPNAAK